MKYIVVGCRYNGTKSLLEFVKSKGYDVIENHGLFDLNDGFNDWYFKYKDRTPLIIISEKKKHLFNFDKLLKKWGFTNPIILNLEELKQNPNFPHLHKASTLQGTFKEKHKRKLDAYNAEIFSGGRI